MDDKLTTIRKLSKECPAGLLFSYKALKKFNFNYQQALLFLRNEFPQTRLSMFDDFESE